jgi:hypothetical protein
MTKNAVAKKINGNVVMVIVSSRVIFAMVNPNVKMDLMKVIKTAALENSHSTMIKNVVVKMTNGNVTMVTVLSRPNTVMVKLNVLINQMKVKTSAVSENSNNITLRSVVATLKLNGPVPMAIVSNNLKNVMEKLNALMDLTKVTKNAALRNSNSTMIKNVVVKKMNGNVELETVSMILTSAMVQPIAQMDLMKEMTNVVSDTLTSTTIKFVFDTSPTFFALELVSFATASSIIVELEFLEATFFITFIRSIGALLFTVTNLFVVNTVSISTLELTGWVATTNFIVVEVKVSETTLVISFIRSIWAIGCTIAEVKIMDTVSSSTLPFIFLTTTFLIIVEFEFLKAAFFVTFVRSIRALSFSITFLRLFDTIAIGTGPFSFRVATTDLRVILFEFSETAEVFTFI